MGAVKGIRCSKCGGVGIVSLANMSDTDVATKLDTARAEHLKTCAGPVTYFDGEETDVKPGKVRA